MKTFWKFIAIIAVILGAVLSGLLIYAFFLNPSTYSTSTYRNGLRLRVVRQLSSALVLYFKENHKYPDSLNSLVPNYIGVISSFPILDIKKPSCLVNEHYEYYSTNNGADYLITFCLPEKDYQYSAGYHLLNSAGIK